MTTAESPPIHSTAVAPNIVATSPKNRTGGPDKPEHTSSIDEVADGGTFETGSDPSAMPDTMMPEPQNEETGSVHEDTGSAEGLGNVVAPSKPARVSIHTSQQDQGATSTKHNMDRTLSPPSRKRGAFEAGMEAEQDRPKERRRDFSQEEKKRGQRLFGGLLNTLSQKPPGRRPPVERKQIEKLQQRKDEDSKRKAEVQERLAKLNRQRKIQQIKLDEQTMRARHRDMLAKAYSLQTKTRPPLYYRPWEFTREEEEIIDAQVRDVKEDIAREVEEFERTKQQRLERLGVQSCKKPTSGNDDRRASTVGEPLENKVSNSTIAAESTNRPHPKPVERDHDEVVETEEDTVIY